MEVETQDFYLSAFLRLKKLEMLGMKSFGSRKLFIFEDNDIFQKLKQEYYWNKAVVDPLEYKKEIRILKDSIMHS
ncbi:MAG: hypothetical protein HOF29_12420 [Candidatus Marinimicrobia bacterium]|jgi:hypothetical protein|nr:hypothetical protein [Candidatus Neomarinimicrobiota bacterium]MBT3760872.1 hypothetical protein [Candidatus Neomarinimicrobiota bacterium]MBT3896863.1 hypothetical protein [Candidatus Neomarinimicrobiota bacterium]MBT5212727.1 hypothetical protein [Candidatus Neomarinimicrobiota bacterium]MBT5539756.1 hypothetical protein [Candidatus Neomarinimicrobiota bacterium]